jgi:hypothetical protein
MNRRAVPPRIRLRPPPVVLLSMAIGELAMVAAADL